jgi:hypothetical protein
LARSNRKDCRAEWRAARRQGGDQRYRSTPAQGSTVIIAFDADAKDNEQVRIARFSLAKELRSRGATVAFLEWEVDKGKGIDDHLATVGPEAVLAEINSLDFDRSDWRANLIVNKAGQPRALLANAITALREAPEWSGVLALNEFSLGTAALLAPPFGEGTITKWSDQEDRLTADWLQRKGICVSESMSPRRPCKPSPVSTAFIR